MLSSAHSDGKIKIEVRAVSQKTHSNYLEILETRLRLDILESGGHIEQQSHPIQTALFKR